TSSPCPRHCAATRGEQHRAGPRVVGELAVRKVDDVLLGRRRPPLDDDGAYRLAPASVGDAGDGDLGDEGDQLPRVGGVHATLMVAAAACVLAAPPSAWRVYQPAALP